MQEFRRSRSSERVTQVDASREPLADHMAGECPIPRAVSPWLPSRVATAALNSASIGGRVYCRSVLAGKLQASADCSKVATIGPAISYCSQSEIPLQSHLMSIWTVRRAGVSTILVLQRPRRHCAPARGRWQRTAVSPDLRLATGGVLARIGKISLPWLSAGTATRTTGDGTQQRNHQRLCQAFLSGKGGPRDTGTVIRVAARNANSRR